MTPAHEKVVEISKLMLDTESPVILEALAFSLAGFIVLMELDQEEAMDEFTSHFIRALTDLKRLERETQ